MAADQGKVQQRSQGRKGIEESGKEEGSRVGQESAAGKEGDSRRFG